MASNPPGQCCTIGVKHDGTPKGELKQIAGTETYVATPSDSSAHKDTAILFLSDVIGHKFNNAQLIADQFASNGYLTIMPDLFHGDPVTINRPGDFDFMAWMSGKNSGKPHTVKEVEPLVQAAIKYLKEEVGVKRIGAVGYCFGAKYLVRAMDGAGGVDVGFVAHPSLVEKEELAKIKGPFSIAAAETDMMLTTEKRHESEEILKKAGHPYQINLYSGVEHGFAVRADITKPVVKFAKEQAFIQAVQWFDYWLVQ